MNSGIWWWTGRPGLLWFMGSQRVGHDWATELKKNLKGGYTLWLKKYYSQESILIKWLAKWLSHFSRVWLCGTPETAAHQAPPSLGFSRQEHWSGLPFPSPMRQSEKWKWSRSVVSDSVRPHRPQPNRLPPSLGFSKQEHWSGLPFPSPMRESEKSKGSRSVVSDS